MVSERSDLIRDLIVAADAWNDELEVAVGYQSLMVGSGIRSIQCFQVEAIFEC